jgi:hypothetical protein
MAGACEFDWSKGKQETYACVKCGQIIKHIDIAGYIKYNAVVICNAFKKDELKIIQ